MRLYNGTGCLVFLVGSLSTMPMAPRKSSHAVIIVSRKRHCFENTVDKVESYRVVLNQNDAFRIKQFGFPGMTISVRGDLRADNKAEIIAEKVEFIDFPSNNQSDAVANKSEQREMDASDFTNTEMSYWFEQDGSMRKELLYVH
jgi:hypothetical protein